MPESIRWTVLPDGLTPDAKLRLTVLVSPRLTGGTQLASFGNFIDWPATLARYAAALQVEFRAPGAAGVAVSTAPQPDRYPPADSAIWQELFRTDTKVNAPTTAAIVASAEPLTLRSFPSKAVHTQVTGLYETAVTATAARRAFPDPGGEEARAGGPPNQSAPLADAPRGPAGAEPVESPNGFEPPQPLPSWDHPYPHDLTAPLTEPIRALARSVGASYRRLDGLIGRPAGGGGPAATGGAAGTPAADNPYRPRYIDRSHPDYEPFHAELGFAEAYRFYDRRSGPPTPGATADPPPPPPEKPDLDFHSACALLADYPELLRRFGLAIDLLVTPPAGLADQWQARVSFVPPHDGLNAGEGLRPWTSLRYAAGQRFEAYAQDSGPYGRRMLGLGDSRVHVTDLDVDGAAMKFVEFSRIFDQLVTIPTDPASATAPDSTALPALHGAGITVLIEGRDAALADQLEADARHTAGVGADGAAVPAAILDAAHLVRGYRVDVGVVDDATGQVTRWQSLCARTGSYTIRRQGRPPLPIQAGPDEGHVKASTVTQDQLDARQHYVHQALFGWHGWSLAAPPPGRTIGEDNQPHIPAPEISPEFPLDTTFRPQRGSLPALRYQHTYRLRARLVDLAGNGLGPDTGTVEGTSTGPLTYGRWEPVPPPAIVPRWPFLEGESEPRLVIRSTVSDEGTPMRPDEWAMRRNREVPDHEPDSPVDGLNRQYRSFDERHLSPPKTSLQMAEQHGVYDAVFGPDKPAALRRQFFAAASREAGSYLDTKVSLPENPDRVIDLKATRQIHVAKHNARDTEPLTELPVLRGDGLSPGEYVVHDGRQLMLPYLPDVMARGLSLRGLPGAKPNEIYSFPGPWPQARPLRLKIEEGSGPPVWRGLLDRELTVFLPKAEFATVRMSCHIHRDDLETFHNWRLLTGSWLWNDPTSGLPPAKKEEITAASADGENWMITPWVALTLVHAVEKPLERPVLGELTFHRRAEATFADLSGSVRFHAKSTGRIDVNATWQEWSDDVTESAPERITGHAHVGDVTVEPGQDSRSLSGVRHEFRDTRHRNVTYTPTATTRFREYFHPAITARTELITRGGLDSTSPSGQGWSVPSTRRPEPPELSHIVPTFQWERTVDHRQHRVTRTRRRAGVRVYVKRPWFSSGDDELLAVVLDPGATTGPELPDQLVTRYGTDPVWSDTTASPSLTAANFPNAEVAATGRVLAELVGGQPATVDIAAFVPEFDERVGLWYCDIDVALGDTADGTAYFPYLRLAVARYQPHSVEPLHLSKVTTAEFTQLVPDRTVSAAMATGGTIQLELSGPVAANSVGERVGAGLPGMAASRRVLATFQRREVAGSDLSWADMGSAVTIDCAVRGGGFAWSGLLTPPAPQLLPPSVYRLRIEEYETYLTDRTTATGTITVNGTAFPVGRRLIHADHFGLAVSLLGKIVLDE
ncbi:hypothetical protein [Streptomyces zagrosensis]|uniref:Uncharacterized protein n=1 Tax=Streptomyces zagrosensis TaxID=1042984 RepID=A0A7W9QI76_9ACTN|nr:hypothetical protein [Streptomyces zagrosensis]MBB5939687.1 hypothetical protein [Streptomyces zagrosensis]